MTELEYLESTFFKVLGDLKEYLDDLTLVGGWLSYVYAKYVWGNLAIKPVTTADIDFGLGVGKTRVYPRTIFELLSSLDYKERHPQMDRMYPVVLYKEGKVRLDFIAPPTIEKSVIDKIVGSQIDINIIEKFDFLLKYRIIVDIKNKKEVYIVHCPKPSAFLYHKAATFIDREDEQKQAKDLHYMYFILRYAPDTDTILKEIAQYYNQGYFKEIPKNLSSYFERKTSKGCLMVEKENGPDPYIDDLRQDIFERFKKLQTAVG
ncbi:MAG: GSU2403 family nucleotidyltransferase fold protein [Candidatus Omnitrophota bacterium]